MPQPRLVKTSAGLIELAELGSPSGQPVLMLHHGFGTYESLMGLARALAGHLPEHRFVCYSRPGCGTSPARGADKEIDYLEIEARQVAPAVLEALSINSCDLIGHSDGGTIALLLASLWPEKVRTVAAMAPHVFLEERTLLGILDLALKEANPDWMQRLSRRHANVDSAYVSWRKIWLSGVMRGWSVTSYLTAIRAPVLLIQGDADEFGTLDQLSKIDAQVRGRVEKVILPGVGHEPHKQCPETVKMALVRQLRAK